MDGWVNEQRDRKRGQIDGWADGWFSRMESPVTLHPPPPNNWPSYAPLKNKRLHYRYILLSSLTECVALSDSFYPNDLLLLLPPTYTHVYIHKDVHVHSLIHTHKNTHMHKQTNKQTQSYSLTCFSSTGGQLQQAPCQVNILKPCALTAEGKAQCWKHTLKYEE